MIPSNDPEVLREQYGSDYKLKLRQQTHDVYSVPRIDFPAWVLSRLPWRGGERILDVGTGTGVYSAPVHDMVTEGQYIGLDLSAGMLETHPAQGHVIVGDAQHLPFADGAFDVIMANYMLHHVPDVEAAIREFKRALKPDGVLVTATNSATTMPELNFLFQRAIVLLGQTGSVGGSIAPIYNAYTLENGTRVLARQFYTVVRYDMPSAFVFPTADPLITYMNSLRSLREPLLPKGIHWDDVLLVMREQANRVIAALGELVIQKVAGVLVASDQGGAVADFVHRLHAAHPR
ncbi:MAG: class I SAM-dependent methyltransferase [bacterium]|nr:class I SAM-dependent methyltransferase [bacterium]